jgi:hypothetical protein
MNSIIRLSPTGEPLLSPAQVAARQGITTGYLAACRLVEGHALKFIKVGKNVFYREADVIEYFDLRQSEKRLGRKRIPETGDLMKSRVVSMTNSEWAKVLLLGGSSWVRAKIKEAEDV